MNEWLFQRFESNKAFPAITEQGRTYLYSELLLRVEFYIHYLKYKIPSGKTVALYGDFSFNDIALFLAASSCNYIVVPILKSGDAELEVKLNVVNADYVVATGDGADGGQPELQTWKPVGSQGNALTRQVLANGGSGMVLFSSGSSGEPKAMLHDMTRLVDSYKHKKEKHISIMLFLLYDHIGGINSLLSCLAMGARAVVPDKRDPLSIARLVEMEKITVLPVSPTFLNLMMMSGACEEHDVSSLRMITYGTEPMPESLLGKIKEKLPKVKLLQTFGTSETGIAQVQSRSSTSVDIRFDNDAMKYKVVDGELWLKSDTRILGYLNAPNDALLGDGWFRTSDLVEEHGDGYIQIVGRNSEIINVGGEKVMPIEVEDVIVSIAGVSDCLVYGVENVITGQTVVADVVVPDSVDIKAIKSAIRKRCSELLPRYKQPTKIQFVDHIAYGTRGKKLRH